MVDAAPLAASKSTKSSSARSEPAPQKASETRSNPPIDTTVIRRYYMEGDFDPAIDILETALRYKSGFSKSDSIFMFKHLGVMYTAKYETREKGKLFMRRLLEVDPTSRILDMYASDMIYMIFKNIKDEFDASQQHSMGPDTAQANGRINGRGNGRSSRKESSSTYLWLGISAAVVVAGGAATYFYFSDEPRVDSEDHQPD
jgi:hypothetical protein